MLSQLLKSQDAIVKSQDALVRSHDATAKSLENRIVEATKSQPEANKSLEAKLSGTDDKLSHIAYKQIEQIAEMSDLVDRMSTVERSLQCSPVTGSDPTLRSPAPRGRALVASAISPPALTASWSFPLERSKPAEASHLLPPIAAPLRRSL